jgi:DNA invertase Pin-like site-specific DNA recombinase
MFIHTVASALGSFSVSTHTQFNYPKRVIRMTDYEEQIEVPLELLRGPIAYGRVSTKKQMEFGNIKIPKQYAKICQFLERNGLSMMGWIYEQASSVDPSSKSRPKFLKAIERAYLEERSLVVSDISRITRDVELIRTIMVDLGIEVIDVRHGGYVTYEEAKRIVEKRRRDFDRNKVLSKRGTADARASGKRMGNPRIEDARSKAIQIRKGLANDFCRETFPKLLRLAPSVSRSSPKKINFSALARRANELEIWTRLGHPWSGSTVRQLFKKALG